MGVLLPRRWGCRSGVRSWHAATTRTTCSEVIESRRAHADFVFDDVAAFVDALLGMRR